KTSNTRNFSIEEREDSYVLHSVEYADEVCDFTWTKELLDGGNTHTQDYWVKITDQLPDARDYYTSLLELYKNKDGTQSGLVEKVRQMFAKDFKDYWMMTSTRITYKPKGKDKVTHNYNIASETSVNITFVGPDDYVNSKSSFEDEMEVLFGTRDCKEVSKVFKWVTKKATYLYRINSTPQNTDKRAVVLGVVSDFVIYAYDVISSGRPARGVVVARETRAE
ncbi:hypothetical protein HYV79_02470, partial [Candidatus Woesearchaeota archaeon]|nr:hypothetical protein [Candidatus Woesearchaeota archaeon]